MPRKPKPRNDTMSRRKWRETLTRLRKYAYTYIRNEFGTEGRPALEFLSMRFSGAGEIIIRSDIKVGSVVIRDAGAMAVMASSKLLEKGPQRILKVRTFEGDVVEIPIGTPPEEGFHVTQVGPYGMKCTCEDAVMTSSKADKEFFEGLREAGVEQVSPLLTFPLFSRFVLCKHTLALLAYLMAAGNLSLRSRVLRETLKIALIGAALRAGGRQLVGKDRILATYYMILKRAGSASFIT